MIEFFSTPSMTSQMSFIPHESNSEPSKIACAYNVKALFFVKKRTTL